MQLDAETLAGFLAEARGYLPGIEACLAQLAAQPEDTAPAGELHRLLHSLSGASLLIGLTEVGELAHAAEDLLEPVVSGGEPFDSGLCTLVTEGLQAMRAALDGPVAAAPAAVEEDDTPTVDAELLDGFLEEAHEHLVQMGERLRELSGEETRAAALKEIRRSMHTLKGAAGMVGLKRLSQLAHRLEDVLDALDERPGAWTEDFLALLAAAHDLLHDIVAARGATAGRGATIAALTVTSEEMLAALGGPPADRAPALPAAAAEPGRAPDYVRAPLARLDQLMGLTGQLFLNRSVLEQQMAVYARELGELSLAAQRAARLAARLEAERGLLTPGVELRPAHAEFDALEFDRYTELHLLSRDLAESASDLATATRQLSSLRGEFATHLRRQSWLHSELQTAVASLRMLPLETLSARLYRTVRVAAGHCGKQAELTLEGFDTAVDKALLEQLAGPLEHLLRNAVDHGIEPPEVRAARGKPASGEIRLSAACEGPQVALRLSDDGAGFDAARLRDAAVRLGACDAEEAERRSLTELLPLVFLPGFSTAGEITEISGRGIGMDAVKAAVDSLRGTINVRTEPGAGSQITVRVPLSLAALRVLLVEEGGTQHALPLESVTRVTRVDEDALEDTGGRMLVQVGGRQLHLLSLGEWLAGDRPGKAALARRPVVVLRSGDEEIAVSVDRVAAARDVVVKPLPGALRAAPASAATILGDGTVVLILDPVQFATQLATAPAPVRRSAPLTVLVVDDSLSVRRVVARLLRAQGWEALEARDGIEALDLLQHAERLPDAVMSDVEMPRMDGFDFVTAMRADPRLRQLPVLMLTSRSGEKHRAKAAACGVDGYLVKPYEDALLLADLRRLAARSRRAA